MNVSKRILTASVLVCSLALTGLEAGASHAYPPRQAFTMKVSTEIIKPLTGRAKLTLTNTCPGAVKIFKNNKFYKVLNASQGKATAFFGSVPSGIYRLSAKSCTETASTKIVYVPKYVAPVRVKIGRKSSLQVKFAPKGTPIIFYLKSKKYTAKIVKMPSSGTATIQLPKNLFRLGKNFVTFKVGKNVQLSGNILGVK